MTFIISLEGNIGCGKSTLLERIAAASLQTSKRIRILKEPVDEWAKVKKGDKTILELFYEDPRTYAFEFQILVYMSLYNAIKKQAAECDVLICERSLESNIHIFAEMLYDKGWISESQMGVLRFMADTYKIKTDYRVYLFCPATICHYRVRERARQGEEKITLEYLHDLQTYHRNFFFKFPHDEKVDNYESPEPQDAFIFYSIIKIISRQDIYAV